MGEAVYAIDNEKDLSNYISSFANKVPARTSEIKYEKNPVLNPPSHNPQPMAIPNQRQSDPQTPFGAIQGAGPPRGPGHGASYGSGSISASGPPQLSTLPFQNTQTPPSQQAFQQPAQAPLAQNSYSQPPQTLSVVNLPPLKP